MRVIGTRTSINGVRLAHHMVNDDLSISFIFFSRNNAWWRTFRESLKKVHRWLFFLRNHLNTLAARYKVLFTLILVVSQLIRMLFERHGVFCSLVAKAIFHSTVFVLFHCSPDRWFMPILKTAADSEVQSHILTNCIKNRHRDNLKSLIFKHCLFFIHNFKNASQPLKTVFCKPIAHKYCMSSFNLFHLVQTRDYSC